MNSMKMLSVGRTSNLSDAILTAQNIEKNCLKNQNFNIDRARKRTCSNYDRQMDSFLQLTQKRHDAWHRNDKYFRDALKKEKDRHEKRKKRHGSKTDPDHVRFPSLITLNSLPEPMTKVEQRTFQVLQESQKFLEDSSTRSRSSFQSVSRPSTTPKKTRRDSSKTSSRSSNTSNCSSLIVPMTQSIDFDEYNRQMNESLKRETYNDFVEHFIKFRPEYREQFARLHQSNKRQDAVEKIKEFNHEYAQTKDKRFYNLVDSLIEFHSDKKRK